MFCGPMKMTRGTDVAVLYLFGMLMKMVCGTDVAVLYLFDMLMKMTRGTDVAVLTSNDCDVREALFPVTAVCGICFGVKSQV